MLFLYLNRHGYSAACAAALICAASSMCRLAATKSPISPKLSLHHFAEKAQNAEFYCESYEECMQRADSRTVVYCDPALCAANGDGELYRLPHQQFQPGTTGTAGAKGGIADEKRIPVLISNHRTPLTQEWYKNAAETHIVKVRRSISSNGGTRKRWTSY